MADQKPISPEVPRPAEPGTKKYEKNREGFEMIEKAAETESEKEERLIDELAQLRAKMGSAAQSPGTTGAATALDADIEQRKEKIIANFVKAARAAAFGEEEVGRIMDIAERYIRKEYPDIADAIHDRIIQARDEQNSGKMK